MRSATFYIIFFSILILYFTANYYILSRILKLIPHYLKLPISIIIIFSALAFLAGRMLEQHSISAVSDLLIWVGALWMGYFVYLLLGFIAVDASHFIVNIFNTSINYRHSGYISIIILSFFITACGYIVAISPKVKEIPITINKPSSIKELRIAFASDIHLGTIISNSRLQTLVSLINDAKPDLIIFGGDILDEDLKPVIVNNLGELLVQLKSKYGVIAVPGNHEYIGGIDNAIAYLESHNITVLRDDVFTIDTITFIGRDDRRKYSFTGIHRATLESLLKKVDTQGPVIVIDHQPIARHKTASLPIDVILSGHSHHGQLFPFNFITKIIYDMSWGYTKIENTHIYVSSGFGTWGPPIRTSSWSEIVLFTLTFNN